MDRWDLMNNIFKCQISNILDKVARTFIWICKPSRTMCTHVYSYIGATPPPWAHCMMLHGVVTLIGGELGNDVLKDWGLSFTKRHPPLLLYCDTKESLFTMCVVAEEKWHLHKNLTQTLSLVRCQLLEIYYHLQKWAIRITLPHPQTPKCKEISSFLSFLEIFFCLFIYFIPSNFSW